MFFYYHRRQKESNGDSYLKIDRDKLEKSELKLGFSEREINLRSGKVQLEYKFCSP